MILRHAAAGFMMSQRMHAWRVYTGGVLAALSCMPPYEAAADPLRE
jgi:hypothetical protein